VLGSENDKIDADRQRREERAAAVKAGMPQGQDPRSELSECRES
jgi:hypothetical protein